MRYREGNNPAVLAIIPARGGSKGLPGKNILPLAGKPLINYSIEEAYKSRYINTVIVSTDDPVIAGVAEQAGVEVPFLRPAELAADNSPSEDAIVHAINWFETNRKQRFDLFVLLQPTSPLRTSAHIDQAIDSFLNDRDAVSLISITPVSEPPAWMKIIDSDGGLKYYQGEQLRNTRRQDLPPIYIPNGAVYLSDIESFKISRSFNVGRTIPLLMQREDSFDIDTELDLKIVEMIIEHRRNRVNE